MIPPSGTLTFLFTDVEGSTRLWQAHQPAMTAALRTHDAILRETLTGNEGYIFKTVGDAFCCAFQTAERAVQAALQGQRLLAAEAWPAEIGSLRVRMAVHAGTADERDGDYFGPALNRIARLLAAGHGGQILLSAVAAALVGDDLPPGASLIDLGSHHLKDLIAPESIFQLTADGLAADFPPLRTLELERHNLPLQATSFVGRPQVETVIQMLRRPDIRLITLTGVGGTGKTRLSLRVAAEVIGAYEHGVYFVDLSQVTEPDAIAPAIINSLGIAAPSRETPRKVLENYLAARQLLLILDNFEQIVRGASLITALLAIAPRLKVLVTSRELLQIYGEYENAVPPLGVPDLTRSLSAAEYMAYEAVALFVSRAEAIRGDFQLNEENARAVAEICVRLDGLPLAIELAAARTRLFTPQALLARLKERLDVLGRGAQDRPERQQTLRSTIDWSYNLLNEAEQKLFRRLAVFSGGWRIEAAEEICRPGLSLDILDGLESLHNKSLIRRVDGPDNEPRFDMLVTIGEYAREQLAAGDEEGAIRHRHADYFAALSDAAAGELRARYQMKWLDRLDLELDNIRAALGFYLDGVDVARGVAMTAALRDYWINGYKHVEGESWLRRAVALADQAGIAAQVDVVAALGMLLMYRIKIEESFAVLERATALAEELGDPRRMAWIIIWKAMASAFGHRSNLLQSARESVDVLRAIGDRAGVSQGLNIIGENLRVSGDIDAAEAVYLELIPIAQEIGDFRRVVFQYSNLTMVAYERRDAPSILKYTRLGLPLSLEHRVEESAALFLGFIAVVSHWNGRHHVAGRLLGAADRWYEEMSIAPQASDAPVEARVRNEIRQGMHEFEFGKAWESGRLMSLLEAVALAEREIAVLDGLLAATSDDLKIPQKRQ